MGADRVGGNGHGGGLTGVRNCYCDLCKPLKQRYNRNRKIRIALEEVIAEQDIKEKP